MTRRSQTRSSIHLEAGDSRAMGPVLAAPLIGTNSLNGNGLRCEILHGHIHSEVLGERSAPQLRNTIETFFASLIRRVWKLSCATRVDEHMNKFELRQHLEADYGSHV